MNLTRSQQAFAIGQRSFNSELDNQDVVLAQEKRKLKRKQRLFEARYRALSITAETQSSLSAAYDALASLATIAGIEDRFPKSWRGEEVKRLAQVLDAQSSRASTA
ncbi:hypothetical protein NLJ89_g9204 [Agrocybe chaxingu]|uniref:Uncharacterized protein n=1 Tax=Agrocybe chaxingu TaxID=84603 RepID=A0A9W8MS22_9AGAR|nr:hypothetical protein NLJ89_g9204 [Agrocybe chaxingu]